MWGAPFAPRRLARLAAVSVFVAGASCTRFVAAAPLTDPRIDRLTIADGLPDGTIYSIAQDGRGFLWFGTQYGLARYDGYQFHVYEHDPNDPRSISTELVNALLLDRGGYLWVGTWGGGLERYDPQSGLFRHFHAGTPGGLADARVQSLFEDSRGALWIGTNGSGLQKLDPANERFVSFVHDPGDRETLSHGRVWDVVEGPDGAIWVATGAGVDRLDPATGDIARNALCPRGGLCLPHEQVRVLLVDSRGSLWAGTREGLALAPLGRDGELETFRSGDRGLGDDSVNALWEDRAGRIWIGTVFGGAQVYEPESGRFRTFTGERETGLRGEDIRSIFEDRAGLLWMGTRGDGVIKLDPRSQFRRNLLSFEGSRVASIVTSSERWAFAGGPHGLTQIDRLRGEVYAVSLGARADVEAGPESEPGASILDGVSTLHVDDDGGLWVGTERGRLLRFVVEASNVVDRVEYQGAPFDGQVVRALARGPGPSDELWIGTASGIFVLDVARGAYRLGVPRARGLDRFDLEAESITALVFDGESRLSIGTQYDGLLRFDLASGETRRFENVSSDESLPGNNILSLFRDTNGVLWVGTRSAGLARWDERSGSFRSFGIRDGLASHTVHAIAEAGGVLWMSTPRGLSRWNPETGAVRNFGMSDGLQQMSFLDGAVHRAADGELFFGGRQGYVAFHPEEIEDSPFIAPVQITALRLFGQPLSTERPVWALDSIELGPGDDYLSIEFAALDFTNPSGNRFQYRLEGYDHDWVDAGGGSAAHYTNLDGGNYQFRVRGSNHDGVWNETEASLAIRVTPAWWERASVRWAVALGMALLIALAVRRRLSRAREIQESLETLVRERTKELETKTDELEASYRVLEELSHTDALTGLRNRRYFDETIGIDVGRVVRQYEQALREGREPPKHVDLLFVTIDLDRFKLVNDTFGHQAGDEVLQQLSKLLRATCRDSDLVVRWGGEEFLIVLRSTERDHASKLVEQLRLAVESRAFDLIGGKHLDVTCSLGFAVFPFDPNDPRRIDVNVLLELADHALYEAKRGGRNTWVGVALGGEEASPELVEAMGGRVKQRLRAASLSWIKPERELEPPAASEKASSG